MFLVCSLSTSSLLQLVRLVSSVIIPILGWDFAVVEIKPRLVWRIRALSCACLLLVAIR